MSRATTDGARAADAAGGNTVSGVDGVDDVADVVIVGCGPAGATLANLLGLFGVSVAVLEREAGIYPLPRAIHFDGEVMRVFETAGLRAEVEQISRPGLTGMHFVNADGQVMLIRGGTAERGPHGCATNHYFHQPELEEVLRGGLRRFQHVQVRLRREVTAIEDGAAFATVRLRDLEAGRDETLRTRYVVGCDGARSLLRRVLGSPMTDLGLHQPWLVFDVRLKPQAPELPGHTVQHCDPARPMTYCNVTGNRRRWEIMLLPGDDPAQMTRPEQLWKLVRRWISPGQADIERAAIYTFHALIAQGWRRGRLMLAGDAAHQTPPFLGQGMCAAIRDAANLAWKLAEVLRGRATDTLLDSYETERAPHVHAFIDLAVQLGGIIQTTDPAVARARDEKFRSGSPEIFEFPAPRLGPGVWRGDAFPVARIFPQPTLADGRLLDTRLGLHFAVIGEPGVVAGVQARTAERWSAHEAVVLPADDPALHTWLARHDARAVMLRPDRYVMGLARDSGDLDRIAGCLPEPPALSS